MSVVKTCERIFLNSSKKIRSVLVSHGERNNIRKKKALIEKVRLSEQQEKEIQDYFQTYYGKKIPTHWHRLYQSYTGVYCKNYFPEILFSAKLEPITNPYRTAELMGDKNLLEPLFGTVEGIHIPKTYVSSVRGVLRDGQYNIITRRQAVSILEGLDRFVIKKTVDTSSGRDVTVCRENPGDAEALLGAFGADFVVQELVEQSPALAKLNSSSINTFRVITYFCREGVHLCPVALRIGRASADRDNVHAGGISIGVSADGTLKQYAFSEFGEKFDRHPDTGVLFEGYRIEGAGEKLRETAARLHARIPWLGILSWDLGIDAQGRITLLEVNTTGQSTWFPQMVTGQPLFGEDTPEMLKLIRKK